MSDLERKNSDRGWTVKELAAAVGLNPSRLRQLLIEGKELQGEKIGPIWFISDYEARRFIEMRGR